LFLNDHEPVAEGRSHRIGIGHDQLILKRYVLVKLARRLVRRLRLGHVGDQPVAARRCFLDTQHRGLRTYFRLLARYAGLHPGAIELLPAVLKTPPLVFPLVRLNPSANRPINQMASKGLQ
jgi:hypothetical protein